MINPPMVHNRVQAATALLLWLLLAVACGQQQKKRGHEPPQPSPPAQPDYNLNSPEVFRLPSVLDEISGIAFHQGRADTVYAEQDEEGRMFYFHPGDQTVGETKFGKKGDYEDIQIFREQVIMLRSDGVLFSFPLSGAVNKKVDGVQEQELLPAGEYEGLYADDAGAKLYVLCKHCDEKTSKTTTGYIFSFGNNGMVQPAGSFVIDVTSIAEKAGDKKLKFEPAALAWNQQNNQWYILSSVNKMLVTADSAWNIKKVYPLNPSLYNQPEGIAFDRAGNLYIANEKGNTGSATLLRIAHTQAEP